MIITKSKPRRMLAAVATVIAVGCSTITFAQDEAVRDYTAAANEATLTAADQPLPAPAVQAQETGMVKNMTDAVQSGVATTVEGGRNLWSSVITPAAQRFAMAVPVFLKALLFLIGFWIVGSLLGATTRKLLDMTKVDDRAIRDWGLEAALKRQDGSVRSLSLIVGALIKWLLVLFGFVAFFNILNLTMVAGPLQGVLDKIIGIIPNLLHAAVILFVYWAVAAIARSGLVRLLGMVKFDERLGKHITAGDTSTAPSAMMGRLLFYIILLFGIPPFLQTLGQQALVEPLQTMLSKVLGFLPNLFAAAIIVIIGRIVSTIVREVVLNVLAAAGIDKGAEKIGLGKVLGANKPSVIASKIAYFFILIPIIVSAIDSLAIKVISDPLKATLEKIMAAIPAMLVAAVIIIIGVVVAKIVRSLVETFLSGIGVDALPGKIGLEFLSPKKGQMPLSGVIGAAIFVIIMLITAQQATASLQFQQLAELLRKLVEYLPSLIVGLLILLAALSLGKYVGNLVSRALGNNPNAATLSLVARAAVSLLGISMALEQLGVGETVVIIIVAALLGGASLALGLAFGLGGKDKARDMIDGWKK